MGYIAEHERKVRGEPVHLTKEEKAKTLVDRRLKEIYEKEAENREEVEAKFLLPKPEHFIVTDPVKEYKKRIELWLKAGFPVHIIGPTGCGKTALALHVAEKLGKPVVWINGDEAISTSDLIGGYSRLESRSISDKFIHNVYKSEEIIEPTWVDNPLTLACKYGYTLIYNEFSRAKPEANNILLGVLQEGILELPTMFGEERYIKVHPDFNLILTSNNIEYAGVHKAQDALLDRMPTIYMDFYDEDTEKAIVKAHTKIEEEKAVQIIRLIRALRGLLKGAEKPGTRPAIMIAQGVQHVNPSYDKEYFTQICLDAIASKTNSQDDWLKKKEIVKEQIKKLNINFSEK